MQVSFPLLTLTTMFRNSRKSYDKDFHMTLCLDIIFNVLMNEYIHVFNISRKIVGRKCKVMSCPATIQLNGEEIQPQWPLARVW